MNATITARLCDLGVTPCKVSTATGHRAPWLGEVIRTASPKLETVRQVAEALGLDPCDLVNDTPPRKWPPPPEWLVEERARKLAARGPSPCAVCGRRMRIAARGMCAACYQRGRREKAREGTA